MLRWDFIEIDCYKHEKDQYKSTYFVCLGVRSGPVVSVLHCQSRDSGFISRPGQKFWSRLMFLWRRLAGSAMMNTMTVHCQWEDETAMERTGHPSSHAEARKMKLLTLYTLVLV